MKSLSTSPIRSTVHRSLDANRHVLETLVQYAYEQDLIKKKVDLKSLFTPNTLEDVKI